MSKGTKNVFNLEEYKRIWTLLETTFSDNESEKPRITALLNGQALKSAGEVRNAVENDSEGVTYSIECTYRLFRQRELLGENYVDKQFEQISKKLETLEKTAKSRLDKVYVIFKGDELDDALLKALKERKNTTQEKLVVQFRFAKDISDFTVFRNDRMGWCDVWDRLKERLENFPADEYTLRMGISQSEDVTNLRYYVPLWRHFRKEGKNIKLKIQTDISQIENSKNDRTFSVGKFLSLISGIQSDVTVDEAQLGKSSVTGDMPPLLYFEREEDIGDSSQYDHIIKDYVAHLAKEDTYVGTTNDQISKEAKETLRLELFEFLFEKLDATTSLNLERETFSSKNTVQKIIVELFKIIRNRGIKLTLLIFLMIMRSHLEDKSLIDSFQMEDPAQRAIDKALFEAIWTNAKSSAEGLQQIIENAQVHSCGKVAYLGMRIHRASPNGSMSQLTDQVDTRKRLWDRFWHNNKLTNNIFNERADGKVVYPDFIEFFVLDDAIEYDPKEGFRGAGIVKKFNSSGESGNSTSHPIQAIKEIFELTEKDYSSEEEKLQFYIRHYGMRWFKQHIENLNGIMEIYSPYPKADIDAEADIDAKAGDKCIYSNRFSTGGANWFPEYDKLYSTEYSVLVPLAYSAISQNREKHLPISERLFLPFSNGQLRYKWANLGSLFEDLGRSLNAASKFGHIEALHGKLKELLERDEPTAGSTKEATDEQILLELDASTMRSELEVEVLAKAIFHLVFTRKRNSTGMSSGSASAKLFLAVRFSKSRNSEFAKEFIRIFTIFYLKQDEKGRGKKTPRYMQDVQIAVCSDAEIPEVNFILGGKNLRSAYITANNFAYYNAEASLDFVPLLDFLSAAEAKGGSTEKDGGPIPLFPFDLYLKDGEGKSWFEKQMCSRLETDLRTGKYGCKIPDIRIRLGSKIHIDTFYEAELLFHNVGTVKRFAYLLAKDIYETFQDEEHKGTLFLLGYENYSSILVQEVHTLLQEAFKDEWKKIEWLIETHAEDYPVLSFDKFFQKDLKKVVEAEEFSCITILPLGSTMTTLYKLHDAFLRGVKRIGGKSASFIANYCLVAIGNAYTKPEELKEEERKIPKRYLALDRYISDMKRSEEEAVSGPWRRIHLLGNTSKEKAKKEAVKFLLSAGANWIGPGKPTRDREENDEDKPLLRVDKTSTLLDTIFPTPLQDDVLAYYTRNEEKVKKLEPVGETSFFRYGHIVRGENHYQFYFDFEKLVQARRDDIIKWAREKNQDIEPDAFNVVISPLQITNSEFLKIVTDCAFGSNLHLLHINIQGSGKETIRTKFDYISTEFSRIAQQHRKINLYYVDDSICTGSGLARAWKFLVALCDQTGQKVETIFPQGMRFKKIFLLVNRSSYETAQMWTMAPKKDWLSFIDLCIPSYNTHMSNDAATCPECKVRDRYTLLRKRSASNQLIDYFGKRVAKCAARNPQEYDLWLKNKVLTEPSYFWWFCEWVYYKTAKKDKLYIKLKEYLGKEGRTPTIQAFGLSCEEPDTVLDAAHQMIAEDDSRRLQSMDKAYRKLLYNATLQKTYNKCLKDLEKDQPDDTSRMFAPYLAELKKEILSLLADCFKDKNTYDSVFDFISYIKVISRDYLAKNYFIKETMYRILYDIFNYQIGSNQLRSILRKQFSDGNGKSFLTILRGIEHLPSLFQYRIFKVIAHRLSLVRSTELIQKNTMEDILKTYGSLKERASKESDEIRCFLPLSSLEEMQISYLASVKTAAIEENNDNICIELLNTAIEFSEEPVEEKSNEEKSGEVEAARKLFIKELFLENTRVLYGFMQELSNCCSNYLDPVDGKWKYSGYMGMGSLAEREALVTRLLEGNSEKKECVRALLDRCYNDIVFQGEFQENKALYHNPLNNYLQFYWKAFCGVSENAPVKEYRKIAEMLNYFNILRYLTESAFSEKRHENFGYLPYIFEDLCIAIKNMTQTKACYLVYKKEGESSQLVAHSGYTVGKEEEFFSTDGKEDDLYSSLRIGPMQFDELIAGLGKDDSIIEGVSWGQYPKESEGSTQPENPDNSHKKYFFKFEFPFGQGDGYKTDEQGRKCYLFLETGIISIEECRRIAMRVLFPRNRLWEAIKENYAIVLNYRYHCNYIQSIIPPAPHGEKTPLRFLHLSDLHLQDDKSWERGSERLNLLCDKINLIKAENNNKHIDLLVVTGDVVNASDSAASAQKKYKRAANFLFEIAKRLWGKDDGDEIVLPHDWKRRILITTGNHDYAAMNDVRVFTESRRITTGLPAAQSGGTMSKYTYFIEFLGDFLDAPMQKLLRQDLNEIREYRNFGLMIGVFNSCSQANALQNNKVMFNKEQLVNLFLDGAWRNFIDSRIVLSHHSPRYVIDYFKDKYSPWKYKKFEEVYCAYIASLRDYLKEKGYLNDDDMEGLAKHSFLWTGASDDFEGKFRGIADEKKDDNPRNGLDELLKSELYRDMEMFYNILCAKSEDAAPGEYQLQFLSNATGLFRTMLTDNDELHNQFEEIFKGDNREKTIVIAGHEHELKYNGVDAIPETFVGDQFYHYEKGTPKTINFALFTRQGDKWVRDAYTYVYSKKKSSIRRGYWRRKGDIESDIQCEVCESKIKESKDGDDKCGKCGWCPVDSELTEEVNYPNLVSLKEAKELFQQGKNIFPTFHGFLDILSRGFEMALWYCGKKYGVMKHEEKFKFYLCDGKENSQEYTTMKEFGEKANIDGDLLKDIWDKIERIEYDC